MEKNLFEPPHSDVETQDMRSSALTRTFVACFLGLLFGYLLWARFLYVRVEWLAFLMPLIKLIANLPPPDFGRQLAIAALVFLTSIPNTVLVSAICAYSIRRTHRPRFTLYFALSWPILLFALHWLNMAYRQYSAARKGMNPELLYYLDSVDFSAEAILIFLTYALFVLLVVLLMRISRGVKSAHSEPETSSV